MTTQDRLTELITDDIVSRARGIARSVIKLYRLHPRIHDDVYSAANLGLVVAAGKYEDGRGSFWGFASGYVRHHIVDELREQLGRTGENTKKHSPRTIAIKRAGQLFEWDYPSYTDDRFDTVLDRDLIFGLAKNDRLRGILILKLLGYTHVEVGEYYGISEGRVSQIINRLPADRTRVGNYETWL